MVEEEEEVRTDSLFAPRASTRDLALTQSRNVQSLKVNKLRYHDLKLVGRDKEIAQLKQCCFRAATNEEDTTTTTNRRELVLIRGESGAGKSSLAWTLRQHVNDKGVLVSAKFDPTLHEEPYAVVVKACQDLCAKILDLPSSSLETKIREKLDVQLVGIEAALLSIAVPLAKQLLSGDIDSSSSTVASSSPQIAQGPQCKELLESAFRKFLRVVSTSLGGPLVLILDDLQWCTNVATIELILKGFLSDPGNPQLLVVGCYRSNEVDEKHILSSTLRSLRDNNNNTNTNDDIMGFRLTEIEVGNIGVSETNQILMTLLSLADDPTKTEPLAEICHKRTLGNAFFLLVFVDTLDKDSLLSFNLGTLTWKWDISQIKAKTVATANIVELIKNKKIKTLSPESIDLVQLAACLGNEFKEEALFLAWSARHSLSANDRAMFQSQLETLLQVDFLERMSNNESLRWLHDKLHEAASSLESPEAFSERQYQVGCTLYQSLDEIDLEASLFIVVNLLNKARIISPSSPSLYKLNLRAAKKAKGLSSFDLQAFYAETGISYLPNDSWTNDKETTLELYTIRAEASSYQGDFDTMKRYCTEVLSKDHCTLVEKIPCYEVWMDSLARSGKMKEAVDLGIVVLKKLGCKLGQSRVSQSMAVVLAFTRFKREYRKLIPTLKQVEMMPLMSDPVAKCSMKILFQVSWLALYVRNQVVMQLAILRMLYLTLEFGLAETSPAGVGLGGLLIMHGLGDWKTAMHTAEISRLMQHRLEGHFYQPCTNLVSLCVDGWTHPVQSQMRYMMEGYTLGIGAGNTDWSFYNILFFIAVPLLNGRPLPKVEDEINIYLPQFEALNASSVHSLEVRMFWQLALNLMGRSENTTLITGSALNEANFLKNAPFMALNKFLVVKSFACVHFGDHELGAEMALKRGNGCYEAVPGCPCVMPDPFLRAMSLFFMARRKRGLKYRQAAYKARAIVEGWVQNGNPNIIHQLKLLDAERAALLKKPEDAKRLYSEAARSAVRAGEIHDAGLASEHHADYLLQLQDKEGASRQACVSIKFYSDWGATRKVEMLREKYKQLLQSGPPTNWSASY